MKIETLTAEEITVICLCINRYGTGEGPVAEPDTIQFFKLEYVVTCLMTAMGGHSLTDAGKEIARVACKKIATVNMP